MARFLRNIRVFTQPITLWTRQPCRTLFAGSTNSTQSTAFANKVFSNKSLNINPIRSCARAFSCSGIKLIGDKELAVKLEDELKYEKAETVDPKFIKNFLENNPFKIEDKPDYNTVTLTRTFGDERIRVTFDITNPDYDAEPEEFEKDNSTSYYTDDEQQEVPEEEVQPRLKFPYRCSITVEKDNKGALAFDTVIDDGALLIEHVAFFADGSLVDGTSSEAEWKRRSIYNGPTYDTLDDDIQRLFDAYLQERGITASVALFIPSYAEYKEQQEYIKWIERLRNFLDG